MRRRRALNYFILNPYVRVFMHGNCSMLPGHWFSRHHGLRLLFQEEFVKRDDERCCKHNDVVHVNPEQDKKNKEPPDHIDHYPIVSGLIFSCPQLLPCRGACRLYHRDHLRRLPSGLPTCVFPPWPLPSSWTFSLEWCTVPDTVSGWARCRPRLQRPPLRLLVFPSP